VFGSQSDPTELKRDENSKHNSDIKKPNDRSKGAEFQKTFQQKHSREYVHIVLTCYMDFQCES